MSDKVRKRRRRRARWTGWGLGKIGLAAVMAAAMVPAVMGYMHHRELGSSTGERDIAPPTEISQRDSGAAASDSSSQQTGPANKVTEHASDQGAVSKPEPSSAEGKNSAHSTPAEGSTSPPQAAASSDSPKPGTSGTDAASAANNGAGSSGKTAEPSASPGGTDVEASQELVSQYEDKLKAQQQQCMRKAGVVVQLASEKSDQIRRGELDKQAAADSARQLSERMNQAEADCSSSFKQLMSQAQEDSVPASKRNQWQESYDSSSRLLKAKMGEQLQGLRATDS